MLIFHLMGTVNNVEILTLAVTIGVAVIGWIFALWFQRNNMKRQHKVQIKYDIYEYSQKRYRTIL